MTTENQAPDPAPAPEPTAFVHWPLNGPPRLVWYSNKALHDAIEHGSKARNGYVPDLKLYAAIPAPEGALPALPEPHWPREYFGGVPAGAYTSDQMHAYARAALAAHPRAALDYRQANPLGGPAKVFRAMADAIEAGDSYEDTLRRYRYAEAKQSPAEGDTESGVVFAEAAKLFKQIDALLKPHGWPAQKMLRDYVEVVKRAIAAANPQPTGTPAGMPPNHWDEWAMKRAREFTKRLNETHMPPAMLTATMHCALIDAMFYAAPAQAPAPAPETSLARPFSAVKSFADSVLAMLDERIKAVDQAAHPFNDYFGDKPETIVAAKAQAGELREVRTQVRILADRALVELMKFRPATQSPAVGAGDGRQDIGGHIRAAANTKVAQQANDDTRRLDYLQKKQATISLVPDGRDENGTRHAFMVGGWHCSVNRDIRAAIDAAMGASQPPVQGSQS